MPAMWAVRGRASCVIDAAMHGGDAECRVVALTEHNRSERAVQVESRRRRQQRGDAAERCCGTLDTPAAADAHRSSRSSSPGSVQDLGDRPLVVVTATRDALAGWLPLQDGLARLSNEQQPSPRVLHA